VVRAIRYQIKHGAQSIKICATAGVLSFEGPVGAQQYSFEEQKAAAGRRDPQRDRGLDLWQQHRGAGQAVISIQVLQENFWLATRKMGVDPAIAIEKLLLFQRADVMQPDADAVVSAARCSVEHRLSSWDAMIVQMAQTADCAVLFSGDLQAGRRFARLEVVNPFA
jgi:predicted nucleic acid-binding protein